MREKESAGEKFTGNVTYIHQWYSTNPTYNLYISEKENSPISILPFHVSPQVLVTVTATNISSLLVELETFGRGITKLPVVTCIGKVTKSVLWQSGQERVTLDSYQLALTLVKMSLPSLLSRERGGAATAIQTLSV